MNSEIGTQKSELGSRKWPFSATAKCSGVSDQGQENLDVALSILIAMSDKKIDVQFSWKDYTKTRHWSIIQSNLFNLSLSDTRGTGLSVYILKVSVL